MYEKNLTLAGLVLFSGGGVGCVFRLYVGCKCNFNMLRI